MANEASIRSSIIINGTGNVAPMRYQSQPTGFNTNMSSSGAPSPGGLLCTIPGIIINISEVGTPGLAVFKHLGSDITNVVEIGIYNGTDYYPFIDLLAGDVWVIRLSQNLLQELVGTSPTPSGSVRTLYAKASNASVNISVDVFPK